MSDIKKLRFTPADFHDFHSYNLSASEVAANLANKRLHEYLAETDPIKKIVCGHDPVQTLNGWMCLTCRVMLQPDWVALK